MQKMCEPDANTHEQPVSNTDGAGKDSSDDVLNDEELSLINGGSVISTTRNTVRNFTQSPFGEWFIPGVSAAGAAAAMIPLGNKIKEARNGNE